VSDLARRIRRELERTGKSARAVSLAIGQSKNFVQSILDGSSKHPSAESLTAIARELGVNVEYLLTGHGGAVVDDEAKDGLQVALSEPWWEPGPLPPPDVAAAVASEARSVRNRLGTQGALDAVYWRAYLQERLTDIRRGGSKVAAAVVHDTGGSAADDLGPGTKSSRPRR
jgi:transcriptional regulator with XRE-family HTH domain